MRIASGKGFGISMRMGEGESAANRSSDQNFLATQRPTSLKVIHASSSSDTHTSDLSLVPQVVPVEKIGHVEKFIHIID